MIAKAKACVGGSKLIGYVINEKKGYELDRNNLSGENPSELFASMQVIQNQNLRCQNNTISIVLSPEKDDGKKLTNDEWRQLSKALLSELGVDAEQAQYISFIHTEQAHKHLHIVLNRVKDNGKLIKDHYIGKRVQHIAHKLAKEMDLKSAMEIKEQKQKERKELLKDFRSSFKTAHESVKNKFPENIEKYSELMRQRGFTIIPTINKQGDIQGYRVDNGHNEPIKLSEIDRKIKLDDNFFKTLAHEKEKHEKYSQSFEQNIISQEKISYKLRR